MKLPRNSSFVALLLYLMMQSVSCDDRVCHVEERPNIGLKNLDDPSQIVAVRYEAHTTSDCYRMCCNDTSGQCNAVSYYRLGEDDICMLLSCQPFQTCVWTPSDGFTAARVQLASVADISETSSANVSMTLQQPAEHVESSTAGTTTLTTTIMIQPVTTTSPETPPLKSSEESVSDVEQAWNIAQPPEALMSSPVPSGIPEESDWNMGNPPENIPEKEEPQTTLGQESLNPGDVSFNNQTDELGLSKQIESNVSSVQINSEHTITDEPWNVDSAAGLSQLESNKISEIENADDQGLTDDVNGDSSRSSTVDPWNIISFNSAQTISSNNNEQANNGDTLPTESDGNGESYESDGWEENAVETGVDEGQNPDDKAATNNDQSDDTAYGFMFEGNEGQMENGPNEEGEESPPPPPPQQLPSDQPQGQESSEESQPLPVDWEQLQNPNEEEEEEEEGAEEITPDPRPTESLMIQSPGIIIGLCSALGVSFLVLVAVCRKVYMNQDRPRYKPLRDYDIRFEPPAASSALLP